MLVFIPIQSVRHQIASFSVKSSNGSLLGLLVLVRRDHFIRARTENAHDRNENHVTNSR